MINIKIVKIFCCLAVSSDFGILRVSGTSKIVIMTDAMTEIITSCPIRIILSSYLCYGLIDKKDSYFYNSGKNLCL